MIEPQLRYCSSVCVCCSTTDEDRLQKLQNRAITIITNSAFDAPVKPLLVNVSLKSIRKLSKNELKLIALNSLGDLASNYLRQPLNQNSQQSSRALKNRKDILSEDQHRGMVSKLVLNGHPLWHLLSCLFK